jgi:cell division protease FtsH
MIEAQYKRAIDLLEENKDKLTVLAELLLEKEVIFKDDLQKIFGKRPFEETEGVEKNIVEKEEDITPVDIKTDK